MTTSSPALSLQAIHLANSAADVRSLIEADDPDLAGIAASLKRFSLVVESAQIIVAEDMRRAGCSWAAIGTAFGISKQAAHERFS